MCRKKNRATQRERDKRHAVKFSLQGERQRVRQKQKVNNNEQSIPLFIFVYFCKLLKANWGIL